MRVAAHQPNLMPWLGFFAKAAACDVFVLDDESTNMPATGFWGKRVRVLHPTGPAWLTIPLRHQKEPAIPIREMEIAVDHLRPSKVLTTFDHVYRHAPPHSVAARGLLESYLCSTDVVLASRNEAFIRSAFELLGIAPRIVRQSDLDLDLEGSTSQQTAAVALAAGGPGAVYVSGDGARAYQDAADFDAVGLALEYLPFEHPVYRQGRRPTFEPGLTVIDALAWVGGSKVCRMLRGSTSREQAGDVE